uniref:hAT-like transposase RNase-H fold domain-containing protein n=1 Tax=Oryza brachyantha TaxID=4533 RepID=J3MW11_ORYBR
MATAVLQKRRNRHLRYGGTSNKKVKETIEDGGKTNKQEWAYYQFKSLLRWFVEKKMSSLTLDNVAANDVVVKDIISELKKYGSPWEFLKCVAECGLETNKWLPSDASTRFAFDRLTNLDRRKYEEIFPTLEEWEKATKIHALLKIFHDLTKLFSVVASFLDPRFKMKIVKFYMKYTYREMHPMKANAFLTTTRNIYDCYVSAAPLPTFNESEPTIPDANQDPTKLVTALDDFLHQDEANAHVERVNDLDKYL